MSSLAFRYLEYGIYVDLGVGNGYRRDNGGDLPFLDTAYRLEHHFGKPRQRRPWFNKSWYISVMVHKDKLAEVIGEEFAGLFDNLEQRERGRQFYFIGAFPFGSGFCAAVKPRS